MQCLIIRDIRSLGIKRNNEGWVSDNKQMAERVSDYKRYLNQKEKLIRERVDYLSGDKLFGNFSHKREAKKLFVNFPISTNPQYWEKLPCMLALSCTTYNAKYLVSYYMKMLSPGESFSAKISSTKTKCFYQSS